MALQIGKVFANAVSIFILPPSWEELRSRLERRGEDSEEVIEMRLKNAATEVAQVHHFDFVIINELFDRALFDLQAPATEPAFLDGNEPSEPPTHITRPKG